MKKNPKAQLRSKADQLYFKHYLQEFCEVCGKKAVHLHHYYPKGLYSHLRYDKDNGISLCFHCHFSKTHKGDPTVHEIIRAKRGEKWYNRLKKKALTKPKPSFQTMKYYRDIIEKLNNMPLWKKTKNL